MEKYLDGQTSESEEQQLRCFFAGDVPDDMMAEKKLFEALSRIDEAAEAAVSDHVAEGVEHRMSRMIDQWNRVESTSRRRSRNYAMKWLAGVAASMLLLIGVSYYVGTSQQQARTAALPQDTYNDPRMAYKETEKALQTLSENLNKGIQEMEKIKTN